MGEAVKKFLFKIDCHGYPVTVGINRKLQVSLDGYDEEYERSMIEFGERPSKCLAIIHDWNYDPLSVLTKIIGVGGSAKSDIVIKGLIFSDWIEHLIKISIPRLSQNISWKNESLRTKHDYVKKVISEIRQYLSRYLDADIEYEHFGDIDDVSIQEIMNIKEELRSLRDRMGVYYDMGETELFIYRIITSTMTLCAAVLAVEYEGVAPVAGPSNFAYVGVISDLLTEVKNMHFIVAKVFGEELPRPGHVFIDATASMVEARWQIRRFCDVCRKLEIKRKYPRLTETT